MSPRGAAVLLIACAVLTGCACGRDRVVLLPDATGKVGKINVKSRKGEETLLTGAYESARTGTGGGKPSQQTLSREEVQAKYGKELATLPPRPAAYFLYFNGDSDQLTEDSKSHVPEISAEIARRPAAEVLLIGHTDTVGSEEYNDELSMARANAVKLQLVSLGLDAGRITVSGRGERDLVVATPDGTEEPRNRTVEVNVR